MVCLRLRGGDLCFPYALGVPVLSQRRGLRLPNPGGITVAGSVRFVNHASRTVAFLSHGKTTAEATCTCIVYEFSYDGVSRCQLRACSNIHMLHN